MYLEESQQLQLQEVLVRSRQREVDLQQGDRTIVEQAEVDHQLVEQLEGHQAVEDHTTVGLQQDQVVEDHTTVGLQQDQAVEDHTIVGQVEVVLHQVDQVQLEVLHRVDQVQLDQAQPEVVLVVLLDQVQADLHQEEEAEDNE